MATNWFEDLFGFRERSHDETQKSLEVVGTTLRSRINQRTYAIGELNTPSVKELRDEAARVVDGLATIERTLDIRGVDELRDLIRIGIHSRVQVTDVEDQQLVSQAFSSALPVSYSRIPSERWRSFAVLVLESAYEATLWAAVLDAHDTGSRVLFLTGLGGGAFGNEPPWIHHAMRRALTKVAGIGLDVRVVSHVKADAALERLVAEFG
jgi:hypothetical protein